MPTDNSPQFLLQSLPLFSTGLGVLRTHLALTHPPPATHVAILYHGVRFTHIAWKGVGAHGCPLQPVCDLSMQLAGHNRHRCDPPFTHAPCLFSTGMLTTVLQPIGLKDRDSFRPAFWGPGWLPIWRHRTRRYVSPTRHGMEWAPAVAPSSLYATSPCSLQGATDTGMTLLSLTPLAFTPLACLATALQHISQEDRIFCFPAIQGQG